jgi:hypothetical protein
MEQKSSLDHWAPQNLVGQVPSSEEVACARELPAIRLQPYSDGLSMMPPMMSISVEWLLGKCEHCQCLIRRENHLNSCDTPALPDSWSGSLQTAPPMVGHLLTGIWRRSESEGFSYCFTTRRRFPFIIQNALGKNFVSSCWRYSPQVDS